ncbi:winged helix-turn-helix transcriptional regulator [Candidatus Woesearchaeota archaeon]|nr:winged helix-turn-helix transcriptional regulator [Candidatus Woesearchaeota archaeon]
MSVFRFKELTCMLGILRILNKGKSTYSDMYRSTKVSHTTLQRALKNLASKTLVLRRNKGHMLVDYEITDKGMLLLEHLEKIKKLVD